MCLQPGDTIGGRYRIQFQLRQGGFGRTYLAQDVNLPDHPQCLVKEITPRSNNLDVFLDARRRFHQEAEALYSLGRDYSQIPELFAYFTNNRNFYLVLEFIEGHPLSEELTPDRQLNEGEVIELVRSILEIIKFVHDRGVIHRDLNPSNLIRRYQDRNFVLIDFGTVKEISTLEVNSLGQTLTAPIGTTGYMPPEQLHGRPRFYSDIYAVGMIGIKALTGVEPINLPRDENCEIVWRSIPGQPMVEVSDGLATILDNMVRYHFSERYQSADQVLQDLADLQDLAVPGRTPRPPRQPSFTEPAPSNPPELERVAHSPPLHVTELITLRNPNRGGKRVNVALRTCIITLTKIPDFLLFILSFVLFTIIQLTSCFVRILPVIIFVILPWLWCIVLSLLAFGPELGGVISIVLVGVFLLLLLDWRNRG